LKSLNSTAVAEAAIVEDVFVKKEGGPDYRAVGWLGALVLLLKTQIGLGGGSFLVSAVPYPCRYQPGHRASLTKPHFSTLTVLALPNVLMTLGIVVRSSRRCFGSVHQLTNHLVRLFSPEFSSSSFSDSSRPTETTVRCLYPHLVAENRESDSSDLSLAVLGQFREVYPGVHSVGDVGFIMYGPVGRELVGWGYFVRFSLARRLLYS
jgi:hypothetical protein